MSYIPSNGEKDETHKKLPCLTDSNIMKLCRLSLIRPIIGGSESESVQPTYIYNILIQVWFRSNCIFFLTLWYFHPVTFRVQYKSMMVHNSIISQFTLLLKCSNEKGKISICCGLCQCIELWDWKCLSCRAAVWYSKGSGFFGSAEIWYSECLWFEF
jgi:hypothetical protein